MIIQYNSEKKYVQLENKVGQQDIKIGAGYESWAKSCQKKSKFSAGK